MGTETGAASAEHRAAVFAALGEPTRLALADQLVLGDLSPGALARALGLGTNLLAHHLRVLEEAGVIRRLRSEGDGRRSYVQLRLDDPTVRAAAMSGAHVVPPLGRLIFVCTANSARSQLAAAAWNSGCAGVRAASAGTHPAARVNGRAVEVARRHGLQIEQAVPTGLERYVPGRDLVIAVCDNAHEELAAELPRLHWSIPDPVRVDTDTAFERAYAEITLRIHHLAAAYSLTAQAS